MWFVGEFLTNQEIEKMIKNQIGNYYDIKLKNFANKISAAEKRMHGRE